MLIEAGERGFGRDRRRGRRAAHRARARRQRRRPRGAPPPLAQRARPARRRRAAAWPKIGPRKHAPRRARRSPTAPADLALQSLALAFPDRLSRRRDSSGEQWQSVGGRGFRLDPTSPLARSRMARGRRSRRRRVGRAHPVRRGDRPRRHRSPVRRPHRALERGPLRPRHRRDQRHAAAAASARSACRRRPTPSPTRRRSRPGCSTRSAATASRCCRGPTARSRCATAPPSPPRHDPAIPTLDDAALLDRLDDWLAPLLAGKRRLDAIDPARFATRSTACSAMTRRARIDRLAPTALHLARGIGAPDRLCRARRPDGRGPRPGAVRPQGASDGRRRARAADPRHHPPGAPPDPDDARPARFLGRVSWRDVAKEMRGRYPRHPWPDDPAAAPPTLRTKRASS